MLPITTRFSRPVIIGALAVSLTAAAAAAGTIHRFAASQTTGSEGAVDFLQTTNPGGALQGEIGSAASTGLGTPFGMFGKYGPPSGTTTKGLGVVGISTLGWGVVGDNIGGGPALYAFPNSKDGIGLDAESDNQAAIYGEAHSTLGVDGADIYADGYGDGVFGSSNGGSGFEGISTTGNGMYGESQSGYGVQAYSASSDGVFADIDNGNSGVAGINDANGNGLYGESATGFGVNARSMATPGPVPTGASYEYAATYSQSQSGPGVYGLNAHNSGTGVGYSGAYARYTGVSGYASDGAGVYGYSANDIGMIVENDTSSFPTLAVVHDSTKSNGAEIVAGTGIAPGDYNFEVDTDGDAYVGGTVYSTQGTFAITRNPRTDTVTYGAESTQPVVEDVGSAHLVDGYAAVAIDGAFRQTLQDPSRYLVFITPEGDSNGLYVTQKSPAGFIVRESRGGRSTLDFDYKIVAQRYGMQTGRLPHLAAISPRMAQVHFEALHPSVASAHSPLIYALVEHPVREGSKRAALLAKARLAGAAAHRRMTTPPAPPPGFLAGAGIHN